MIAVETPVVVNSWIEMDWDEFLTRSERPELARAKGYYYKGYGRFEMLPVGFNHGADHVLTANAVNLFCILKAIPIQMTDSCTYRKAGMDECQPDLSAYIGKQAQKVPVTSSIISLDRFPTPDLAIEISRSSLLDDLGTKRALYENLGFVEYWVIDVKKTKVSAFEIFERGSRQIETSQVLPGFEMAVLEEALQRSRKVDQSQVGAWLLEQFR